MAAESKSQSDKLYDRKHKAILAGGAVWCLLMGVGSLVPIVLLHSDYATDGLSTTQDPTTASDQRDSLQTQGQNLLIMNAIELGMAFFAMIFYAAFAWTDHKGGWVVTTANLFEGIAGFMSILVAASFWAYPLDPLVNTAFGSGAWTDMYARNLSSQIFTLISASSFFLFGITAMMKRLEGGNWKLSSFVPVGARVRSFTMSINRVASEKGVKPRVRLPKEENNETQTLV